MGFFFKSKNIYKSGVLWKLSYSCRVLDIKNPDPKKANVYRSFRMAGMSFLLTRFLMISDTLSILVGLWKMFV